jgi:ribosome-associated protein
MSGIENVWLCYNAAIDKKAIEPLVLDISEISDVADYFLIASGTSLRQLQSIADELEMKLKENGEKDFHIEGYAGSNWILIDAGDLVIHLFLEDTRRHYSLEKLWGDAKILLPEIEGEKAGLAPQ